MARISEIFLDPFHILQSLQFCSVLCDGLAGLFAICDGGNLNDEEGGGGGRRTDADSAVRALPIIAPAWHDRWAPGSWSVGWLVGWLVGRSIGLEASLFLRFLNGRMNCARASQIRVLILPTLIREVIWRLRESESVERDAQRGTLQAARIKGGHRRFTQPMSSLLCTRACVMVI